MALVEEDAVDDALDGLVERRVVEDDVRGLATELEGQPFPSACNGFSDLLADRRRSGERDLVDVGMRHECLADLRAAVDDVHHARRQVGLGDDVGERQRRQRCGLGRLQYGGVAGGERRCQLPCRHQQREVPWHHLGGHAERLRVGAEAGVPELVGPAGVVEEMRGRHRDVDVPRLPDRLAVVEGLQDRELAGSLLDQPGDPEQVLRPLPAGHPMPDGVVGAPGGGDRVVDVGVVGEGDGCEHRLVGGVDGLEGPATAVDELPVDVHAVGLPQPGDRPGLGCGGVLEVAHVSPPSRSADRSTRRSAA